MTVDDLEVTRGDPVLPAWRRLLAWVRGLKVMTGPGIRPNVTPQGVVAVLEREVPPWQHPWKTSTGEVARIRAGTVRGIPARIRDDRTRRLRRLDGRDENGRIDEEEPPTLGLDPKLADDEGKFWIAGEGERGR